MKIAIGVNTPKKIMPKIIGVIIEPSIKPKVIHNLLNGRSKSDFTIAITKKENESNPNIYDCINRLFK